MKTIIFILALLISSNSFAKDISQYRKERSKAVNQVLKLSDKQKAEISTIKDQYKLVIENLTKVYNQAEEDFVKMYQSTNKDQSFDTTLKNQQTKILKAKVALEKVKLEQGLKIRQVLSKKQISGFNKFVTKYPSKE